MKPARHIRFHGVALVLVLCFLALLSMLVLAFFTSVRTELQSAGTYSSSVTVRQLAESTTHIVMGQILDGTQSFAIPGDTGSARLTWASQPGLIRTYADDGSTGRTYKLYSTANMVEDAGTDYIPTSHLTEEVPNTWPGSPALFTDLNKPVLVPDPQGAIRSGGNTFSATYPIVDPLALLNNAVEGFSIQAAPGFASATWTPDPSYNPTFSADARYTANPAPMPVRWLYVLRDGTLTTPDAGGATTATWASSAVNPRPSATNPIVGRVAFWTDDETCKLNINTASEGVFWDRAWANSSVATSPYGESQLNTNVPVRGEYNRYPGHPAMTCLSPVLGGLLSSLKPPSGDSLSSSDYTQYYKPYYDIAPRVNDGGSMGGTVATYQATVGSLSPDANRLYASVDELLFAAPDGTSAAVANGSSPRITNPNMTRAVLEQAKFFLTAYNRSPEVNAFGRPRICLWPLQQTSDPSGIRPRNARDELIAFCSTINRNPYYFQRYSIYQPGINNNGKFGQNPPPSSQHPSLDWSNIPRNQQLYAYLQSLTSAPVPGWGNRITDKYPAGPACNQILTEMVDLIRSGVNTYSIDQSLTPQYYYAPSRASGSAPGETSVVPLVPTGFTAGPSTPSLSPVGTKGTGRFPTVTEAALVFYASDSDGSSSNNPTKMRCALVLQPYTPMAGLWTYSPLIHYKVKGLDKFSINGQYNVFRPELDNLVTSRCGYGSGSAHDQAFAGLYASFRRWATAGGDQNKTVPEAVTAGMDPEVNYELVSDRIPVDITANNGKFAFTGGAITIEIYAGYGNNSSAPDASTLVQTVTLSFPDASAWPIPSYDATYHDFNARIDGTYANIFNANDTVRSVQVDPTGPTKGDLRLVTFNPNVPASYFAPFAGSASPSAPGYFDSAARQVFSMRNGDGGATNASYHADLFNGLNSSPGNPIAARGMKGAFTQSGLAGDFDNGAWTRQDGAYCNKPDDYFGSDGSGDQYGSQIVSPNRQVCSPVMFGSLPSGALSNPPQPWQTLLFCPNPAAGNGHFGFKTIRDHVFLDFFTMPVVEPYAISEPCSTAGKVNLNYQIAPFTYITRSTALRGVMKSTRVMAIPSTATTYKSGAGATIFRYPINRDETLKGFDKRFVAPSVKTNYNGGTGAFRSASEICDMFLIPQNTTFAAIALYWLNYRFTGDNAREFPYGHIYERVTTKSNVYTIHMCVQVLKKRPAGDPAQWEEGKDSVLSEYRGSTMVERYVDPSDPALPDFATNPSATLDTYYKFRVLSTKKFAP